jgi:dihydropyrimidinase
MVGSRSAIAGGTTTIIPFARQAKTDPSLLKVLAETHAKAQGNCYSDYSFHLLVSNPSDQVLAEFPVLMSEGISSIKIYMTYAAFKLSDHQILDVLLESRRNGITSMVHAENGHIIDWMTKKLEEQKLLAPKYHASAHPLMAEVEATYRAICLSEFMDSPILIVHVSSPSSAKHIRDAQKRGIPIYAETCPQYLFLTKKILDQPGFEGAKYVCSPPPRESVEEHEGLWNALEDGTFTIISSDHCPFAFDDNVKGKKLSISEEHPCGEFKRIPNGISGVETRLPLVLSAGRLTPERFVEVTSTNPAKLYGLWPLKGAAIPGESDADLVIWYPEGKLKPFQLKNEMLHHNVDYTAFEGHEFKQWPRFTILRGKVVFDRDNGGLVGSMGYGNFLKRKTSLLQGPLKSEWTLPL